MSTPVELTPKTLPHTLHHPLPTFGSISSPLFSRQLHFRQQNGGGGKRMQAASARAQGGMRGQRQQFAAAVGCIH